MYCRASALAAPRSGVARERVRIKLCPGSVPRRRVQREGSERRARRACSPEAGSWVLGRDSALPGHAAVAPSPCSLAGGCSVSPAVANDAPNRPGARRVSE